MQYDSNTPRKSITVQGLVLNALAPFAEGHVLKANEAAVLNQTFAENIRNNFSAKVEKLIEDANKSANGAPVDLNALVAPAQAELDKYLASYEFGVRVGSSSDPIDREAMVLAKETVKRALANKGMKLGEGEGLVSKEKFAELCSAYASRPDVRKLAERRVKEAGKIEVGDLL